MSQISFSEIAESIGNSPDQNASVEMKEMSLEKRLEEMENQIENLRNNNTEIENQNEVSQKRS